MYLLKMFYTCLSMCPCTICCDRI